MKKHQILLIHNFYRKPGGEDVVFDSEKELLRSNGHNVFEYVDTNKRIGSMSKFSAAAETLWSKSSYNNIKEILLREKPDVVHFHNTFLMISPSAYYACYDAGVPVVQTLHNYRLGCPSAVFYRDGKVCEDCLGKDVPWPGVLHRCYRGSSLQTFIVAAMLSYHRIIRTWSEKVTAYIALTDFSRGKMIAAGLSPNKIFVKPNFVSLEYMKKVTLGDYALFVGRLAQEKGLATLLRAWVEIEHVSLKIVGDGPLRMDVEQATEKSISIHYLGYQERNSIFSLMKNALFLILPSEWYEGFPVTIAEAFACGIPVIASRLGSMAELVRDGETGLLFEPGNADDLAEKVKWLWDNPQEVARMGNNARKEYEEKYTPERNYQMLMNIYEKVIHGTS